MSAQAGDKIILNDLAFYGYHGVLSQENDLGQQFLVDLELYLNLQPAGASDDPLKTVDYAQVYEIVRQVITGTPKKLIEAVAESIAQRLLAQFILSRVKVRVKKPAAPVAGRFGYMAVEIIRTSDGGLGE